MSRKAIRIIAFVATTFSISPSWAATADWMRIGTDPFGAGTVMYVLSKGPEDLGDGNFLVTHLSVHPVLVRGIDRPGADGDLWTDTSMPYRSVVQETLYDCPRKLQATVMTTYYSTQGPASQGLVYQEREGQPLLFPVIEPDPVMELVCR